MTNEHKLITSISVLPVLADFLEDLNDEKFFSTQSKIQAQNLIAQIRKFDERVMMNADTQAIEEQIMIQRQFRQWINE
jgi:hypothetical protein